MRIVNKKMESIFVPAYDLKRFMFLLHQTALKVGPLRPLNFLVWREHVAKSFLSSICVDEIESRRGTRTLFPLRAICNNTIVIFDTDISYGD